MTFKSAALEYIEEGNLLLSRLQEVQVEEYLLIVEDFEAWDGQNKRWLTQLDQSKGLSYQRQYLRAGRSNAAAVGLQQQSRDLTFHRNQLCAKIAAKLEILARVKSSLSFSSRLPHSVKEEILELIKRGRLRKGLDKFEQYFIEQELDPAEVQILIHNLSQLETDMLRGYLSQENYSVALTKLTRLVLGLVKKAAE